MTRLSLFRTCLALWLLLATALASSCASIPAGSAQPTPGARPALPPTSLLQEVQRRGVLRVATDPNYAPQSFQRVDGTWEGFDVEVGRAIARRLGVQVEFMAVGFEQITAGDWGGRWDVHIGSMTITPDRQGQLIFSKPYYFAAASFAVHADSDLQAPDELDGRVVGVAVASTYQEYLSGTLRLTDRTALARPPRVRVQAYQTDALALQDLAAGDGMRLDAVLTALPTVQDAIGRGEPLRTLGDPVYYESLAVALDRASPHDAQPLADAISSIIESMRGDETLARLSRQFYGLDISMRADE
jgi:polar amino acid transport system substrate-binding protein